MSIHTKLAEIAKIKPGETISNNSFKILSHNSWFTSFYRFYYEENRNTTFDMISSIMIEACVITEDDKDIIVDIHAALEGIENLKVTYERDIITVQKLEKLIEEVESFLSGED